jgi:hypothetical protein
VTHEPGYALQVTDRAAAAMQLAAHFTAEAMRHSTADDPRTRLAEQLGFFELAFRAIMGTTARTMIRTGATPTEETEQPDRTGDRVLSLDRV